MDYNMHFLVVDDMDSMRRLMLRNLTQMGFKNIVMASNGADALTILQSQPINAVITDWNMPVMTGLELLQNIRADASLVKIPVLMVTAEAQRHQVELAAESGVSDFMSKPFTVSLLETKLKKMIEKPRPAKAAGGVKPFAFFDDKAKPSASSPVVPRLKIPPGDKSSFAPPFPPAVDRPAEVVAEDFNARMSRKATLLVVDDVADNLDLLVELLDEEFRVKVANGGQRALKILESGKIPDLILLDIMMPEMDGFEVCLRIKTNPATADVPIIFLTAMGESVNITQGLELGAVDYVTKPFDPPILRARIRTHLKLKRSFDEIKLAHQELRGQHAILEDNFRLREEVERIARHDLKNPLGGIINFSSILLEDEKITDDQKEIIRDIEQSAYSALNMVNLSLDLYKMEKGTYEFNPGRLNIAQLINRIVNEKQSELEARRVAVEYSAAGKKINKFVTFYVLGDELLCYSMFGNLFKNAMEASVAGKSIRIDLTARGDAATIGIINHGAVAAEIRERFFDKFVTAGKQGGTGLGTFSARLIAETQQGKIAMTASDELNSTTVTVTLPCSTG
jgi:hypothetical protein